ncbi:MAG: hypothetical protein JWL76_1008 [Thermoleophilia bacterium]|nr:hypothetical protein [Thermoleophilia bacterium]
MDGVRARVDAGLPAFDRKPDQGPAAPPPPATKGTGYDRALLDGVTLDRPTEIVPTALTNVDERVTGTRDDRDGRALMQVGLAGYQFVQAGLHHVAAGKGIVATGSSVLGKVLPTIGVVSGVAQVWRGWNELENHDGGPFAILGSRTARSGLLNIVAGALAFVPGVGTAIGGAVTRLAAAANELDAFSFLDAPTVRVEDKGLAVAKRVHLLDETPLDPYDRTKRDGTPAATAATPAMPTLAATQATTGTRQLMPQFAA